MIVDNTPVEDYLADFGLLVKREDLSCPPPGPPFSKARGVYAHLKKIEAKTIGVLDTYHSQAGHAVARACQLLGKHCLNFYPEYKGEPGPRPPQVAAARLGARLHPLKAGRSAILFHAAKRRVEEAGGYMMPNALKLEESVEETAAEVLRSSRFFDSVTRVIVPASSATITAGVMVGFLRLSGYPKGEKAPLPHFVAHLGYSRSEHAVREYIHGQLCRAFTPMKSEPQVHPFFVNSSNLTVIDEGYEYRDVAKPGPTPPFPCNEHYDLKAFRWWMRTGAEELRGDGKTLLWNVG